MKAWLKFSIRELLLITAVVALVIGWGLERYRVTAMRKEMEYLQWQPHALQQTLKNERYEFSEDEAGIKIQGHGSTYEYRHPNFQAPLKSK